MTSTLWHWVQNAYFHNNQFESYTLKILPYIPGRNELNQRDVPKLKINDKQNNGIYMIFHKHHKRRHECIANHMIHYALSRMVFIYIDLDTPPQIKSFELCIIWISFIIAWFHVWPWCILRGFIIVTSCQIQVVGNHMHIHYLFTRFNRSRPTI